MAQNINPFTHPDFTIDQIIQYTGLVVPSHAYKENMRKALVFFQANMPRNVLRSQDDAGPWNLRINGTKIKLLNWMQAINFNHEVNVHRWIGKGDPLIAYKMPADHRWGNWYTFPSEKQDALAVHSHQRRLHKFKARVGFTCMLSTASDAFVGWLRNVTPEYRHGGARQLFICNAQQVLEPV